MKIYDQKSIETIVAETVKVLKSVEQANGVFKRAVNKQDVQFHTHYDFTVDMCERIRVHAELNTFPDQVFKARAPRMSEDEFVYLKSNYKQVTLTVYLDFLATIMRIFHDANYTLEYEKGEEKIGNERTLQEYLEQGIGEFESLENFIKSVLTHLKFIDANGVIGIRPKEIKVTKDDAGNVVADDSTLTEPIPVFYPSKHVLRDEPNEYMLLMSDEKSLVEYGGQKKQPKGYIMDFYDGQNIWRTEQVGKFEDWKFVTRIFYPHGWNKIPCIKMKGVPSLQKGKLVWVSPFMYAVDLLDLVTVNSAYLQVIINNCVFPYRVMYGDDCEFEYKDTNGSTDICSDGYIYDSVLDSKIICPKCGGTGLKSRVNPFGVMLIRTGNAGGTSDKDVPQTPMAYIEPTIETPKFLMGKITDDEMKARRILHLNTSQTQIQGGVDQINPGANTATGMMTDLKALYAFVKPISDQIFQIWEFIIDGIGHMRYGSRYKKPKLSYPTTFDFYTESDYMENIARAVQSGMPPFVIQTILFKYLQSIFYNETTTTQVFNLIYSTDRLITMSNMDITAKLSRGLIEKWEAILHDSSLTFVQKLVNDGDKGETKFFEKTFEDQQLELIALAKQKADEVSKETQAEAEQKAKVNIDNIMANARDQSKAA